MQSSLLLKGDKNDTKEVIEKNYEFFNTGDMETFVTLYHDYVVVRVNSIHMLSGVYNGVIS